MFAFPLSPDHPSTSRNRRLTIGALVGLALVAATPLAASAHVGVSPDAAAAGERITLQFSFSHGCEDSPTTALLVDIPDAVATVTPVVEGGWTIRRDVGDDGIPTRVSFVADSPVESGLRASVALDVTFSEAAAGTTVAFPIEQQCAVGSSSWTEVGAPGEEEPEHPAPLVAVGAAAADAASGHAHQDSGAMSAPKPEETGARSVSDDPIARWLGGLGLAASAGALIAALWRRRARS